MVGGIYIDMGGDEVYTVVRHSGTAGQLEGVVSSEEPSDDRGSRERLLSAQQHSTQ